MSGNLISLAAEALVAVLLVITIGYCMILNSRLKRLRADESDLRATISELVTATEIAERAIGGLKAAAVDCDKTLSSRLREAEHFSIEIAREIADGQKVLARIKQIASAVRKADNVPAPVAAQAVEQEVKPTVDVVMETGKPDVRTSLDQFEEAVTAKIEDAGVLLSKEQIIEVSTDSVRSAPVGQSRAASRIEELRVMADQARERLKELRKVSAEKAA